MSEIVTTLTLGYRRQDGTAVGVLGGNPYHFTEASEYWPDVKERIAELPLQITLPDGRMQPEYINGELVITLPALPKVVITSEMVSIERDRRIGLGFMFAGKLFDFDIKAKTNISGAAQMAFMAIVANPAAAKSDRWNGGANPFAWRTFDNTFMPLTGEMVIALGQAAAAHEAAFMAAAWKLKDQAEIPLDYTDDKHWPA